MASEESAEDLQPRDRCPWCAGQVEHVSVDPLEEHGIEVGCGYYRALGVGSEVIEDAC